MSVSQNKEVKIEFKISSIDLFEKFFHATPLAEGNLPDVQFDLSINLNIDKENKKIASILNVKIKVENNDAILAGITIGCNFHIVNFDELVINNGDSVTIPDTILETLNIITIGTARGIMYNEFKGTWLHNSILPIIDPKSFKQAIEKKE